MLRWDSPVAVFDFDGTIISGESFLAFMRYAVGDLRYYQGVLLLLPWLAGYALGQISNRKVKEKVIGHFLKGRNFEELKKLGHDFAQKHLPEMTKQEMLEKIKWHQDNNHWLVLASASLQIYLEPWAELQDFHGICGANLEVDSHGRITGQICGNNVFGQEKLDAVTLWLDDRAPILTYAYGDSHGDKELLEWADVKTFRGELKSNM